MLMKFRRKISIMLVIALLVSFLPGISGIGMVYAEEVSPIDASIENLESEEADTKVFAENIDEEIGEDVLENIVESVEVIEEDIPSEEIIDEILKESDKIDEKADDEYNTEEESDEFISVSADAIINTEKAGDEVEISANDDIKIVEAGLGEPEAIYYETNLKVKVLPIAKNIYTGQRDIQIASPIFSQETTNKTIIYLKDDKGEIETNNYGDVIGNAYNPKSGKLVINIPKTTTPGKHILSFIAAAPKGCSASQVNIAVNVNIGIESLSMTIPSYQYYLGNKDINIKPTTYYYNTTHRPMYDSYIKPTTRKAVYSLKSDNEDLLKYIIVNPSNGNIKISKKLSEVFDSIKSKGNKFRIVAVADDFEGVDEPGDKYIEKDRRVEREITLTAEGLSDAIANANEIRGFICHDHNERDEDKERRDIAIIDKNNKTKTSFSIQEAQKLELRLYTSADAGDLDYVKDGIIWKVTGPVKSYRSSDRLWLDAVAPGIITVTAIAADGSGKGSVSRVIEIKHDACKIGLFDDRFGQIVVPASYVNDDSYAFQDLEYMILALNDAETETIIEKEYNDHRMDMEHNYKVKISGGVITRFKDGLLDFMPTEPDTVITLINYNKGSDGNRVQSDKVYTIHNECFDWIDSDFDKVKIPTTKVVENKYEPGKKPAKIKFEVKNLPKKVVDLGGGHTGYYLTLGNSYKAKSKYPNPEFTDMIHEIPCRSEIMLEDGKYYATLTQNIGEAYNGQTPSDFVAGTYKLVATITKGDDYDRGDYTHTLNKKLIETTLIITKNNLKATWEGENVTKVKASAGKKDEPVYLVHADRQDTDSFKWNKNKFVGSVKITSVKYDLDTANIYKADLLDDDKLIKFSSVSGNSCITYTAGDLNKIREAVVNAATGKTTKMKSSSQKAAAKMLGAKIDKNGNYDINKVKPVISGYFTYTIEGTDEVGYHVIKNLKQKFEVTLLD